LLAFLLLWYKKEARLRASPPAAGRFWNKKMAESRIACSQPFEIKTIIL